MGYKDWRRLRATWLRRANPQRRALLMKPDARITDIIESLADAKDYVRGIVSSFIEHGFDKQRSQIRIGVSGKGVFPNYSIVEPCEPEERLIESQGVSLKITSSVGKRMVFHGQKSSRNSGRLRLGRKLEFSRDELCRGPSVAGQAVQEEALSRARRRGKIHTLPSRQRPGGVVFRCPLRKGCRMWPLPRELLWAIIGGQAIAIVAVWPTYYPYRAGSPSEQIHTAPDQSAQHRESGDRPCAAGRRDQRGGGREI